MARKPRIELEGGLYHITTYGNDRRVIFKSADDYQRMIELLEEQKAKYIFFLYAYCLMPNHIHILIERRKEPIGKIMQRILTGYCAYFNHQHGKSGHVMQGRYKAILCDKEHYLPELVRYIHLAPVRGKLIGRPDHYHYSSHREYLGIDKRGLTDFEPVLKRFSMKKETAVEKFKEFVREGTRLYGEDAYFQVKDEILGSGEFSREIRKRLGPAYRITEDKYANITGMELTPGALVRAAENTFGLKRKDICSKRKAAKVVEVKDAIVLLGRDHGLTNEQLAQVMGLSSSTTSRRYESARIKSEESTEFKKKLKLMKGELYKKE